jgi:hypothetical protein
LRAFFRGFVSRSEGPRDPYLSNELCLSFLCFNERGGLLGRRVEAVVEDGASDGPTFARLAEKLITQDEVCTVFSCWTSVSRKMVKPVVEACSDVQ